MIKPYLSPLSNQRKNSRCDGPRSPSDVALPSTAPPALHPAVSLHPAAPPSHQTSIPPLPPLPLDLRTHCISSPKVPGPQAQLSEGVGVTQSTSPHWHNRITRMCTSGCRGDPALPGSADAAWGRGFVRSHWSPGPQLAPHPPVSPGQDLTLHDFTKHFEAFLQFTGAHAAGEVFDIHHTAFPLAKQAKVSGSRTSGLLMGTGNVGPWRSPCKPALGIRLQWGNTTMGTA